MDLRPGVLRRVWRGPRVRRGNEWDGVQRWMWRGPRTLCVVVATARQPVYGLDPVASPCQMVCSVAAALRRWVPYGGGLLRCCAVWFSHSLSARGYTYQWLQEMEKVVSCSTSEVVSSVSTSQSDRVLLSLEVLCGLRRRPNLTSLRCLSGVVFSAYWCTNPTHRRCCRVPFSFSWLWPPRNIFLLYQ